ncbi:DUF4049 domain-containing protein, partial [Escherichia coli]|uniref:DUF4049 domain-containing protein n=1 Tax=Escherichia coli TaxID=562 RepID=UPI00201F11F5
IRCVCGKKIGPDPRNFNQRVSLGRNDLLIRTFPNDVAVTESYKPIWNWKISQYNVSDIKFETMIKPQFADRIYFSNCLPVDPTSTRPTYFGDTDGSVGAVLFALFATGHLGIMAEGENFLREGANKQVISSQADSLIKISRIWADFFPANTS